MTNVDVTRFLVIGAMKSGTTTLHAVLAQQPDVEMVAEKDSPALLEGSSREISARLHASTAGAAGAVTTACMQAPLRPPPIAVVAAAFSERVKLIAILRDPYERAVSHWRHWQHLGRENGAAVDVLFDRDGPYVQFSSYFFQLEPWMARFGHGQMHLLRLEDYQSDPGAAHAKLRSYLQLSPRDLGRHAGQQRNAAESRVVAAGRNGALANSRLYRRAVRPLLPPSVRRAALGALGGARGRTPPPLMPTNARDRFMSMIDSDLTSLEREWGHLHWARVSL